MPAEQPHSGYCLGWEHSSGFIKILLSKSAPILLKSLPDTGKPHWQNPGDGVPLLSCFLFLFFSHAWLLCFPSPVKCPCFHFILSWFPLPYSTNQTLQHFYLCPAASQRSCWSVGAGPFFPHSPWKRRKKYHGYILASHLNLCALVPCKKRNFWAPGEAAEAWSSSPVHSG